MFYKATVQAVILFSAETWNVASAMLARLEGFHIRAAYQMVRRHKPERTLGGWIYMLSTDVLEEVGLHTMKHYIQVRRNSIAAYIMHRPIFGTCRERGGSVGPGPTNFGGTNRWSWMGQVTQQMSNRISGEMKLLCCSPKQ